MKIVDIREDAALEGLKEQWNQLLARSASKTIFLTWEWAAAWWAAYGTPGELRILTFVDNSGVLRGIAPLRHLMVKRYGQTASTLAFIGDPVLTPHLNDSDYLDFIIESGFEAEVMEMFHRHCAGALQSGTVLLLDEIPETSPNLPLLRQIAAADNLYFTESDVACATVRLPETWDEYLATLQSRFRTKTRSVLRSLENRSEVQFRFCDRAEQLDRVLPSLFDLHTRRWSAEGKPGVFRGEGKRSFYGGLSRLLLESGQLRLSWLEWNGQIMACQYGFVYGETYFQLQEGYEPASEHMNLGIGLRAWSIREMLKEGVREYDFMGGVGRHKTNWGGQVKTSKRLVVCKIVAGNLLFCRGPRWEQATREAICKVVPERVLKVRQKLLEPRSSNGSAGKWMREAAAEGYVRLGIPTLTRPLRDRYRLSLGGNGGGTKISWTRRTEPAARILYYHRVNNENDPFFEAIPTDLFEQHMRYLSQHYKVVSMEEVTRHLEDRNSAGMVVAVTFDDGYRDNYENAFPILRRYGLPATIFLTTGSMDSGEPMWFEQLAEAVKKTACQSIDLEFDMPRRFWLRNLQERLQANTEIFLALRKLPDQQRHSQLMEILRQLGAPPESERKNKMLTWDQVRLMKGQGIDFGGHTVRHPFLSMLTPSQTAWEVGECKRRIEQELQTPVNYFAYPNGQEEDFTQYSKQALREAGFRAAVTTQWGVNDHSTDPMAMRRGGPWESSAALFAAKLDWYQLVNE